jgi:hypothetical protein
MISMQTEDEIRSVDGIPVMSEEIGYSAEELVACGQCSKANPPNRLNCFYCGAALELAPEIAAGIQFRPGEIEDWEPGVNLVSVGDVDQAALTAIGSAIVFDAEMPAPAAPFEGPVPLLRVRVEEAEAVAARLSSAGLQVRQIQDRSMDLDQPTARLKGIVFEPDSIELVLFNADEVVRITTADVLLIVCGAIFKSSSEATIKKTRKETKQVDEKFDASDHSVIDIYTSHDHRGFRVIPHGFDFSCLGTSKSLLAVENFRALKDLLRSSFPNAVFDDSYIAKLSVLDHVWPRKITNTSKGMQRVGWKLLRSIGESISNETQFTRYSRMRRELI